jgi:cell division protein FtsI (penicillin-binding protein 3)
MYVPGAGWVNKHNSSFIGFAPVTNPRVVVVITLSGTPKQGGIVAAPVFSKVALSALRVLQVPKDVPEDDVPPAATPKEVNELPAKELAALLPPKPAVEEKAPAEEAKPVWDPLVVGPRVPDFRGKPVVAVLRESAALGMPVEIVGRGRAREQKPPPGAILPAGARIQVEFARP